MNRIKQLKIFKNNFVLLSLTFIFFTILLIAINPKIIKVPYIFGEDGWVFTIEYMKYGLKSFAMTYGGYFDTLSRIFAMIAVSLAKLTNSAVVLANTIKWLSIFFSAFVVTYFTSNNFEKFIKSRFKRIIVSSLTIMLISNFSWLLYNGVAIHWWCGLLIFYVSLNLLQDKMPSYAILPIILISIISTASSMILGFALMYYVFKKVDFKKPLNTIKNIGKTNLIKLILMGLFLLFQAYAILFITDVTTLVKVDLSLTRLVSITYHSILLLISSINLIFGTETFLTLNSLGLNLLVGSILWMAVIYLATKTKTLKYCLLIIIDIVFLYFMIMFKRTEFIAYYQEITSGYSYQVWYHALPAIFIFLTIMFSFNQIKNISSSYKSLEICFLCITAMFFIQNINHPELETSQKISEIEPFVDFNNNQYASVQISPDFQKVYTEIPVSKSYCQEHECHSEIYEYRSEVEVK